MTCYDVKTSNIGAYLLAYVLNTMTYDELRVQLDINDPISVLDVVGRSYADNKWFVVCDEGDCHLFNCHGQECDVREVTEINEEFISKSIKKIVIPSCVTSIGAYAFSGCTGLASVTIPDGVTSIRRAAFCFCSGLKNVTIGNGVMNIGAGAFHGCTRLTSAMIPNNVTSIEYMAYCGCISLKSIIFEDKTMKEVKYMKCYPWGIKNESVIKCRS